MIKLIRNEADYDTALARIENLITLGQNRNNQDTNELEVLAVLVQQYEDIVYPRNIPDPIEAIRFRMEQQALEPRDLIPYIGSRSKVYEVLSGKRPLSLAMIRSLHDGLGIPLESLVKDVSKPLEDDIVIDWELFPIREMAARGWIDPISTINPESALQSFFAPLGGPRAVAALYRKTQHTRSGRKNDPVALIAWRTQVMRQALNNIPPTEFERERLTEDFLRSLAHLSILDNGPLAAKDFLYKNGISLIIEPQLPQTNLDGAALKTANSHPVIGLTLRFDRLDNFWFVLMHECAHIMLHLTDDYEFYDDLEVDDQGDPREREADELAGEMLVPIEQWKNSGAQLFKSPDAVRRLAKKLGIHPAIVAGRVRHEEDNYRLLNQLVGHNEVRQCFPDIEWK